jgi:hypothetical protein
MRLSVLPIQTSSKLAAAAPGTIHITIDLSHNRCKTVIVLFGATASDAYRRQIAP